MAFDPFSRGDLIYKGAPLAEISGGSCHLANGAALVKTLRRGVAGFHKGTLEGTISFTQAVIKTGMKEDFVSVVTKQKVCKVTALIADDLSVEVEGIINAADFSFSESAMVTGNFTVQGKISVT